MSSRFLDAGTIRRELEERNSKMHKFHDQFELTVTVVLRKWEKYENILAKRLRLRLRKVWVVPEMHRLALDFCFVLSTRASSRVWLLIFSLPSMLNQQLFTWKI